MNEVLAAIAIYERAISDKDAAAVAATFDDAALVYDLAPPLVQPVGSARDTGPLEQWFATWDGPIRLSSRDPDVQMDGNLAVVTGLRHLTGEKVEGGAQDLWFRATTVLRRNGGAWKINHVHESVPFAMDGSGRALLDLKPEDM